MTESIRYSNSLTRCPNCGWNNSPYNTLCEKCHAPLRKKDGDNPSQGQEADTRFNINLSNGVFTKKMHISHCSEQ